MTNGTGSDFIHGVDQDLIGTEDLSVEGQETSLEPTPDEQEAKREKATAGFNPTLVLGLGGTGLKALDSLKKMMLKQAEGIRPGLAFLGFDCDENEVKKQQVLQPHVEVFSTTLKNPKAFKRNNEICHEWATQKKFPANALYGASQYRQISRMCLFHHFGEIQNLLREAINSIASTATGDFTVRLDVYIVTSICGGAGSGMYTDIAVLLREIASELALDITLISLFVTGDVYTRYEDVPSRQHPRMLANTYACLKELQYFQDENSPHNAESGGSEPMVFKYPGDIQISLNRPLFDLVLLVESSNVKGKPTIKSPDQLNQFLSNVLFLMTCAPLTENNISMWTNPESGFNMTSYHVNNSPRCFSSLAYAKFMYPEYELVNFLYSSCCKSILEYFLDAVVLKNIPQEHRHDPDRIDPQNRIRAIIQEDMDTHGEWEVPDFEKYFEENVLSRNRFDADALKPSLKGIAKADWDEMKSAMATFRKDQGQTIKELEKSLRNYQALRIRNFDNFLKKLPYDLIENGVGVRWLKTYFQLLKKELDQEEKEANDKKEGESKKRTEREKKFNRMWDDVKRFIDNKPFFRARSKLEDQFNAIVGDMAEYYNSCLTESMLDTVINTYKAMDEIINKRANLLERIIPKFDDALQNYREKERKFRDQLERIAGEKGEESYHMEFSAINLEHMRVFQQRLFEEHDPQSAMKSIFGRTGDEQESKKTRDFWEYEDSGYKAKHVMLYMRSFVSEWVKKYERNLDSILNDLNVGEKDFDENLEGLKKRCSAQWKYSDIIAGVAPVEEEAT
ncbi:MAG: tubulin-like doman-containing protein, partial [Bacteroidota bacterium]